MPLFKMGKSLGKASRWPSEGDVSLTLGILGEGSRLGAQKGGGAPKLGPPRVPHAEL